jgi:hypothetical protein
MAGRHPAGPARASGRALPHPRAQCALPGAELARLGGLSPLPGDPRVTRDARHLLLLRYDPQAFGGHARHDFLAAMAAEGITPLSSGYISLPHTPAIRKTMQASFGVDSTSFHLPCAEQATRQTVWIAQNALLGSQQDMDDISDCCGGQSLE